MREHNYLFLFRTVCLCLLSENNTTNSVLLERLLWQCVQFNCIRPLQLPPWMAVCQSAEVMQPEYHNSYPRMLSTSADISQQLYYHPLAAFRLNDSLIYDRVVDYVSFFGQIPLILFNFIADNLRTFTIWDSTYHTNATNVNYFEQLTL